MILEDPRADGYVDLARSIIGPLREHHPRSFSTTHRARAILDAASGYRIAIQVGHEQTAEGYLDKLRTLVA